MASTCSSVPCVLGPVSEKKSSYYNKFRMYLFIEMSLYWIGQLYFIAVFLLGVQLSQFNCRSSVITQATIVFSMLKTLVGLTF